ncbi:MAG: hypothetical protein ACM359_04710 [Bacillota bacterium]
MATITAHPITSVSHLLDPRGKTPWPLWILDIVFFAFAAVFICLAPCGSWRNVIWGQTMWDNNDPGGPYVISSLYFFRQFGHPPFIGHPGVTLQAMIAAAAHAIYAVRSLAGDPQPFLEFWARNIRWLFIIAGLIIAAMHVVSFHVIYAVARKLLGDAKPAFLAVLSYATLLPTLFYATRISVEPILVSMVLLTLLNLWRMQEARDAGLHAHAYRLACLAAATSAAALLTKFHLSFPLIPLCVLQIGLQKGSDGAGLWCRLLSRSKLLLCYAVIAIVILAVGALSMDLNEFWRGWQGYSPGASRSVAQTMPAQNADLWRSISVAWSSTLYNLRAYFTPDTNLYVFTVSEAVFCPLAAIGLVAFWFARPDKRALIVWPLIYGLLLLPILGYRGYWHYFFLHLAVASVFFAFLLHTTAHRLLARRIGPMPLHASLILLVLLIHSVSIAFVFASKCNDIEVYRSAYRPLHDALAQIRRGQRIAVFAARRWAPWKLHGAYEEWSQSAGEFRQVFDNLFAVLHGDRFPKGWVAANHVGVAVDARQQPWHSIPLKQRPLRPGTPTAPPVPIEN